MASKLFIGSLPYSTTSDELGKLFEGAGQVVSATVIIDKFSGRSKGFGFVEMSSEEETAKAKEMFNNYQLDGRAIVVNDARPERPRE